MIRAKFFGTLGSSKPCKIDEENSNINSCQTLGIVTSHLCCKYNTLPHEDALCEVKI